MKTTARSGQADRPAAAGRASVFLIIGIALLCLVVALVVWRSGDDGVASRPDVALPPPAAATPPAAGAADGAGAQPAAPVAAEPRAESAEVGLVAPRRSLRGRVTRGDDPVANAILSLALDNGELASTRSERDGAYAFASVNGEAGLLVCRTGITSESVAEVALRAPGEATVHDIRLPARACVPVYLRSPDGRHAQSHEQFNAIRPSALARLRVIVTRARPPSPLPWEVNAPQASFGCGRFVTWATAAGTCEALEASFGAVVRDDDSPVFVSLVIGRDVLETLPLGDGDTEIAFLLTDELVAAVERLATTVTVRLHDSGSAAPPPDGRARLDFASAMGTPQAADVHGVATLHGLGSGVHTLVAGARGFAQVELPIELQARQGGGPASVDVALVPGANLRGTVTNERGEERGGNIYVYWNPGRTRPPVLLENIRFPISEFGEFEATALPRDALSLIVATHDDVRASFPLAPGWSADEPLPLRLPATTPVILEKARASASPTALSSVLDGNGIPLWSGVLAPGEVRVLCLAPGRYRVELRDHALAPVRAPVTVIEAVAGRLARHELP